jgi:hypothetical protein
VRIDRARPDKGKGEREMSKTKTRRVTSVSVLVVLTALSLLATPAVQAAGIERSHSFSTDRLTVRNLIGEIRVEGHGGSTFEVTVKIEGRDADESLIRMKATDRGLDLIFPADRGDFVYPRLGSSSSELNPNRTANLGELFYGEPSSNRIKVRGSGKGLELWADVTILVPSGGELEVAHGLGALLASSVDGNLDLSTRSGNVSVERIRGEVSVATGSGEVGLSQLDSNQVEVATGSGGITLEDSRSDEVELASGSGDITLSALQAGSIEIGTGSGDITAKEIDSEGVEMGTGSGDVTLDLWQMGRGEFEIGTGSGDIELTVSGGVSADVHAETNGGEIWVDLAAAEFTTQEKDEVRLTVGGGDARVELGTGSGNIRIRG